MSACTSFFGTGRHSRWDLVGGEAAEGRAIPLISTANDLERLSNALFQHGEDDQILHLDLRQVALVGNCERGALRIALVRRVQPAAAGHALVVLPYPVPVFRMPG
jgi:hypothetical protein